MIGFGELKTHVEAAAPEFRRLYALAGELGVPILVHFQDVPHTPTEGPSQPASRTSKEGRTRNVSADYANHKAYPAGEVVRGGIKPRQYVAARWLPPFRYTLAMRGCLIGLLACAFVSAQDASSLYKAHCAGCHGPKGEGSRGPALRVVALQRAANLESLVELLRRGVPGTEMPGFAPQVIPEEEMRALAQYVLSLRTDVSSALSSRVGSGAALFHGKGKCLDCHRVAGEGISGSRVNEDPFSIQVRDRSGRIRSFLKSELANLNKRWGKSPMPSYADVFSKEELDDLVAYVSSLRGLR